jgi:hypothetical protein
MASTRKAVSDRQVRQRRGNDEQEAGHPYGGDRTRHPPKAEYLNPRREGQLSDDLKRSARKASGRAPKRSGTR